MAKLLYIQASPRKNRSHAKVVADAFVEFYCRQNPADEITAIDLFNKELPPFDEVAANSKYAIMHGREINAEDRAIWSEIEELIAEFKAADKYIFSVPMWNFGIPYRLKHYFDILIQPTYTFSFSPEKGYQGLMEGKPVAAIYARGGSYAAGSGAEMMDFQKPYLDTIFGFLGFAEPKSIIVEPTLQGGPEGAKEAEAKAIKEAQEYAATF